MSDEILRVAVSKEKYTIIQDTNGRVRIDRHGEPWRDHVHDGALLALAYEVSELRDLESRTPGEASKILLDVIPQHYWIERSLTAGPLASAAEAAGISSEQAHKAIRKFLEEII